MPDTKLVTDHYTHGSLIKAIESGLAKAGKSVESATIDDLAPVDEFHIGGRAASAHFFEQLEITAHHRVLDVGCGLGGGARFAASQYGCDVVGVDLTPEYVATGNTLCDWVGLDDKVSLRVSDASQLVFEDESFDRIYLMHVGMNVADKNALMIGLGRLLRTDGLLGIYDIMRTGEGAQTFPVPWASVPEGSEVASLEGYKEAVDAAGLALVRTQNRGDFAVNFFEKLRAHASSSSGPPPLGLHIVMGDQQAKKIQNLASDIARNVLAPVELIARKTG